MVLCVGVGGSVGNAHENRVGADGMGGHWDGGRSEERSASLRRNC